jgi:hypothetical protein
MGATAAIRASGADCVIQRNFVRSYPRNRSWRERNGCGRICFADSPWKVPALPPVAVKTDLTANGIVAVNVV